MKPRTAFALGWMSSNALYRAAIAVADSDTDLGAEVRRKLLGKMSFEHLMRLESEVGEEINRRVRGDEKLEKSRKGRRRKVRVADPSELKPYPLP